MATSNGTTRVLRSTPTISGPIISAPRHQCSRRSRKGQRQKPNQKATTMATLFERLNRGRPSPEAAKPKRQLKNTDLVAQWVKDTKIKTFLMDALAKGPVSATTIQKRGTEQGFTRKQLWRAKGLVGVISFKK